MQLGIGAVFWVSSRCGKEMMPGACRDFTSLVDPAIPLQTHPPLAAWGSHSCRQNMLLLHPGSVPYVTTRGELHAATCRLRILVKGKDLYRVCLYHFSFLKYSHTGLVVWRLPVWALKQTEQSGNAPYRISSVFSERPLSFYTLDMRR